MCFSGWGIEIKSFQPPSDVWMSQSPPPLGVGPAAGLAMERAAHGCSEQSPTPAGAPRFLFLTPRLSFEPPPPPIPSAQGKFAHHRLIFTDLPSTDLKMICSILVRFSLKVNVVFLTVLISFRNNQPVSPLHAHLLTAFRMFSAFFQRYILRRTP